MSEDEKKSRAERLAQALSAEHVLAELVREGITPTRENLIHRATGGRTHEWSAEEEAELPEYLQDWEAFRKGPYNRSEE